MIPGEVKTLTVGEDVSTLDIFLSANSVPVSGKYVGFQLFDAANINAVSGVALNPEIGHYTGSGIIPGGFQLGQWHINWTIVTQNNNVSYASEPFTVNDINVSIGFVPESDTLGSIYEAVRIDVGDPEGKIFDDDFLKRLLIKAVRRLNQRLGLTRGKSRPVGIPGGFGGPKIQIADLEVDLVSGTLTPNNDELTDILILFMEYILVTAEATAFKRLNAQIASAQFAGMISATQNDGVSVKNADGVEVSFDSRRLVARVDMHKLDVATRTAELEAAIKAFLSRNTGNMSKMIY